MRFSTVPSLNLETPPHSQHELISRDKQISDGTRESSVASVASDNITDKVAIRCPTIRGYVQVFAEVNDNFADGRGMLLMSQRSELDCIY